MHFVAVALPFAIAADAVQAACQWPHRAGTPYIACDTARVGLRPPIREPVPAPDVPPSPLPEAPPQPPLARPRRRSVPRRDRWIRHDRRPHDRKRLRPA